MNATIPSTKEICMIATKKEKISVIEMKTDDEGCPAGTNRLHLVEQTFLFCEEDLHAATRMSWCCSGVNCKGFGALRHGRAPCTRASSSTMMCSKRNSSRILVGKVDMESRCLDPTPRPCTLIRGIHSDFEGKYNSQPPVYHALLIVCSECKSGQHS
jgi:hypothetical protein